MTNIGIITIYLGILINFDLNQDCHKYRNCGFSVIFWLLNGFTGIYVSGKNAKKHPPYLTYSKTYIKLSKLHEYI
jgi:hypothetical protein